VKDLAPWGRASSVTVVSLSTPPPQPFKKNRATKRKATRYPKMFWNLVISDLVPAGRYRHHPRLPFHLRKWGSANYFDFVAFRKNNPLDKKIERTQANTYWL
jgi:hypothetical protein